MKINHLGVAYRYEIGSVWEVKKENKNNNIENAILARKMATGTLLEKVHMPTLQNVKNKKKLESLNFLYKFLFHSMFSMNILTYKWLLSSFVIEICLGTKDKGINYHTSWIYILVKEKSK